MATKLQDIENGFCLFLKGRLAEKLVYCFKNIFVLLGVRGKILRRRKLSCLILLLITGRLLQAFTGTEQQLTTPLEFSTEFS